MPVLYSFRRCPYAIRARLALKMSGLDYEHREILLKDKPRSMLDYSPKGTVPVMVLNDGTVLDESLDIMLWALGKHDPLQVLPVSESEWQEVNYLIHENDTKFKPWLDRYKYADRYPEHDLNYYRTNAESFCQQLESHLQNFQFLKGERLSYADMAIAPFIRQFALVDQEWFRRSPYTLLNKWLNDFLASDLFRSVMIKQPLWDE